MVRLRGRFEKGICSFATRFFRKDYPKKIASKKELDKYQEEKLFEELTNLSKFANKLQKEKKRNKFILGHADHKFQVDDKVELDQILNFYKNYGKPTNGEDIDEHEFDPEF